MIKSCLTGRDGKRIVLDSNTHLGRIPFPKHLSPREIPKIFEKAHVALQVIDSMVSRNHALIELSDDSVILHDLNSLNGTSLNGRKLSPGKGVPLSNNDVIGLATVAEFTFHLLSEGTGNHALLVGNPQGLRGVENDIKNMERALKARDISKIDTLMERRATRSAILSHLDMMARIATADSLFVFYFSGHGSRNGLCLPANGVFGSGSLTPTDLFSKLSEIRAKKLVVIDACHSDMFLEDIPVGTLVLTGSDRGKKLWEKMMTQLPSTSVLGQILSSQVHYQDDRPKDYEMAGVLTQALTKLLMTKRGRVDLKSLADELEGYPHMARKGIGVQIRGTTISLATLSL